MYNQKNSNVAKQINELTREHSCFYCGSGIKSGEQIIVRGEGKYYHMECFNKLFSLTSRCLECTNVEQCLNKAHEKNALTE